jgi:cytochrome c peroxidase
VGSLTDAVGVMARAQLKKTFSADEVKEIATFLDGLTGAIPKQAMEIPVLPANYEY